MRIKSEQVSKPASTGVTAGPFFDMGGGIENSCWQVKMEQFYAQNGAF
jgi:hypothetical protein